MTVAPVPIPAVPAELLAMRPPAGDWAVAIVAALVLCGLLWVLARRAGPDGPDEGRGGPGDAPDEPPPAPMPPVCWSELERQFGDEAAAGRW